MLALLLPDASEIKVYISHVPNTFMALVVWTFSNAKLLQHQMILSQFSNNRHSTITVTVREAKGGEQGFIDSQTFPPDLEMLLEVQALTDFQL